jgi:hypothetical protein
VLLKTGGKRGGHTSAGQVSNCEEEIGEPHHEDLKADVVRDCVEQIEREE